MRSQTITVTDAVRNFSEYINRIAYCQESYILRKGNKLVAELRPLPRGRRLGDLPAIFSSLPEFTSEEVEAYRNDILHARNALSEKEVSDPWES